MLLHVCLCVCVCVFGGRAVRTHLLSRHTGQPAQQSVGQGVPGGNPLATRGEGWSLLVHAPSSLQPTTWRSSASSAQPMRTFACLCPEYVASSSPTATSIKRKQESRQAASAHRPSCVAASADTGWCSVSAYARPMRTSQRLSVPSTLPARIDAPSASTLVMSSCRV